MPVAALKSYIERVTATLEQIPLDDVAQVIERLRELRERGSSIYILGNGGSDSLAQHLVLHLRNNEIRAFDLMADTAWLTAMSNDYDYKITAQALLDVLYEKGDMLLVISGSGESENVKAAVRLVHAVDGLCVGILGNGGGKARAYCKEAIVLPGLDMGPLEDTFSVIVHMIHEGLR